MTDESSTAERLVLRRRAERLRLAERTDTADEGTVAIASFHVGEDQFAIELARMRAVVPLRLVTPVPLARPHVIGVLKFDGRIVTAHSLAARLGVRGWRHDPEILIVVELPNGELAALDCEEVPTADALPAKRLAEARARSADAWLEVEGMNGKIVNVVDVARLFCG